MKKTVSTILMMSLVLGLCLISGSQMIVKAEEEVTVSIWLPGTDEGARKAFNNIIDDFKTDNPNVTVDFQQIPWSEYFTKLNVSFAGGTSPDIFGLGYGQMGPVQAAGRALPLDEYLEDWSGWEDIPQNVLNAGSKDGTLYGLIMPEFRFLFYRKDLFAEAGLEVPKNTEELKEYARKFTRREGNRIAFSGLEIPSTKGEQFLFAYMLMSGTAEALWTDSLKPVFDRPEVIENVKEIESYFDEKLSAFSVQNDLKGHLYENGLAAMAINIANVNVNRVIDRLGEDKVGVAFPPGDLVASMGTFLSVSSETKHKEEAIELYKTLTSKEGQLAIARHIGFIPTRKSAAEAYIKLNPKYNKLFAEAVDKSRVYGTINPHFFDYLDALRPALEKIYYGVEDAEKALKEAGQEYREVISESK